MRLLLLVERLQLAAQAFKMRKPAKAGPSRQLIAKNLRIARATFNWSQEQLGHESDIPRTHIGAAEREEVGLGSDTLDRIAAAFGVPTYVLFMPTPQAQAAIYDALQRGRKRKSPR